MNAPQVAANADLIAIAQIIAFGLAALGSVSLSMADDLSLSMTLRLRGNANALNRAAEQNRRAVRERRSCVPAPYQGSKPGNFHPGPDQTGHEAEVTANLGKTRQSVAERQADTSALAIGAPTANANALPAASMTAQQRQAVWAAAMSDEAAEYSSSVPHLPPAEREAAWNRAAALSSCATHLLSGAPAAGSAAPSALSR